MVETIGLILWGVVAILCWGPCTRDLVRRVHQSDKPVPISEWEDIDWPCGIIFGGILATLWPVLMVGVLPVLMVYYSPIKTPAERRIARAAKQEKRAEQLAEERQLARDTAKFAAEQTARKAEYIAYLERDTGVGQHE